VNVFKLLNFFTFVSASKEDRFSKFMRAKYEDKAEELYLEMSDTSQLRILRTYAKDGTKNGYTILMVAGWGSVVLGWDEVLLEAMKDFDIIYLETREKGSSRLAKKTKNNFDRLSSDVKEVIEKLELNPQKLVLFGSSFGAAVLADGFGNQKFDSFLNVLVAPAIQIDLPPIIRYLIPIGPHWFMPPFKPLIRWWLKRSKSESPEQAAKYIRVMNEAQSKKWKNVVLNFLYWKWWRVYEGVENDILLVAAEKDKMHEADVTQKVGKLLKNSTYVNLETNKKTHTKPMVDLLREYLKKRE